MRGHKMAAQRIDKGQPILKFGQIIGFATEDIAPGADIHTHNCSFAEFERDYAFAQDAREEQAPPEARATFQGFRRANGKVGTRNYIGIHQRQPPASVAASWPRPSPAPAFSPNIPTSTASSGSCTARAAALPARARATMCSSARNGATPAIRICRCLVVGLGCEVFQIERLKARDGLIEGGNFRTMTIQDTAAPSRPSRPARPHRRDAARANQVRRETLPPASCASPCSAAARRLFGHHRQPGARRRRRDLGRHGGTAGCRRRRRSMARALLTRRARNPEVGQKLVDIIRWWQDYCAVTTAPWTRIPRPATRRRPHHHPGEVARRRCQGRHHHAAQADRYADPSPPGLRLHGHPGYDPVAATARWPRLQLLFFTSRGSAYDGRPTPSISRHQPPDSADVDDMDINCATSSTACRSRTRARRFATILRVASGEKTKSELLGYGDNEFVPWQIGATM